MQTKISVPSFNDRKVKSHTTVWDNTSTASTSLSNSEKNSVIVSQAGDSKSNIESISEKLSKVHSSSILGTAVKALDGMMRKNKKFDNVKKYNELRQKNQSIISLIQKCLQKKAKKTTEISYNFLSLQDNQNSFSENIDQKQYFQLQMLGQKQTFTAIKFINQGISGRVYLVRHTKSGFIYSLKVIPRHRINNQNVHQLVRQLKIQSYLNHPNIIRLYQFHIDQENIYLFLEPSLGSNLYQQIKNHPQGLPEKQVRSIIRQICSGVEYMHKNDVIHRDLKLENILIWDGMVKICDFGWAVHSPLLRSTRCGTPLYVSPQMLKSEHYDSKIDVWNIGILAYELIYGYSPFQIRQQSDFIKIIEQDIYFSHRSIASQSLQEFISGCLNKHPHKRFCIRQAVEHQFLVNVQKMRWTMF